VMEYMENQDFNRKEVFGGLTRMCDEGKIFRSEGLIIRI